MTGVTSTLSVGSKQSGARESPAAKFTPRGRTMLALVACRAAFRGLWLAAPLMLATTWSARDLALTVTAIGGFGWCTILLASTEKTVLKHVPRLPLLAGQISRATLAMGFVPLSLALVTAILLTVAGHTAGIWAWGLVWAITGGVLQGIAALHRLDRRAWIDALIFGGGAAWICAVTGATILEAWPPVAWLIGCVSGLLVIVLVAVAAVRPRLAGVRRKAAVGPLARSFLLLGLPEVLSLASVSAGYWALAATAPEAASADATLYYAAVTLAGVAGSFVIYLVRLGQPDISLRARSHGTARLLVEARRWLDQALITGLVVAVATLAAYLFGAPGWLTLAGLTLGEVVVFTQRTIGVNRVENAGSRRLPMNVGAAAAGLGVACLVLLVFAGGAGAHAAMGALVAAQVVNALVLRVALQARPLTRPSLQTNHS